MTAIAAGLRDTFRSLGVRNYRLYFIGQGISLCGTWMQRVAQAWLVLDLTGSGTAVGTVAALQFVPMLILAPMGGLIADRSDKRKLLYVTQSVGGLSALILGVVVLTGSVELWMVYALAVLLGISTSIDAPVRQTFVLEMVGREQLTNAVSLNSTLVNAARIIGPAIGGVLIVTVGIGWCFMINAASYLGLITALWLMDEGSLIASPVRPREPRQLRQGLAYAASTPHLALPLLLMTVAGIFAYEYQVVLPLFARFTFGGDAQTFSSMTAAMGVGAVVGGLVTASRPDRSAVDLVRIGLAFGVVQILVALAPGLTAAFIGLAVLGAASVAFIAVGNSTLQLGAAPGMRGRVMGLYMVAFLGTTPIGGPVMGFVGEHAGPRWALAIGGSTVLVTAMLILARVKRLPVARVPGVAEPGLDFPPAKL